MPYLYVTCGISGIGKSTWLETLGENTKVISTDSIRKELWGSEEDQRDPQMVFAIAYQRIHEALSEGYTTAFDAMNLCKRDRLKLIREFGDMATCYCIDFGNEVDTALRHQMMRKRRVPEEVVRRQAKRYQIPTKDEGWSYILRVRQF